MAPPQLSSVGKLRLTQSCHSSDAGKTDARTSDGGTTEARTSDGGTTNATTSNAGTTDTRKSDAGMPVHEGTRGLPIAGSPDAKAIIEEGTPYGGTHEGDAYLATLGITTAPDTVAPPPADHQTEHPDVPVEVSLTHLSIPWTRGASTAPNLIRSDTSKSPSSFPRPPGSGTTPRLSHVSSRPS